MHTTSMGEMLLILVLSAGVGKGIEATRKSLQDKGKDLAF